MSTPKETPDAKFMLREPVPTILLEDNLSACPPEVQTANTKAVAAWDGFQDAASRLRHVRNEQKLAPTLDALADESAVAAGEKLPKERATFAAREAVHACARKEQATRNIARTTQLELAYTINRHKIVWVGDQRAVVEAAQGECLDLVDRLGVAFSALQRERVLLVGLEDFPLGGHLDYCRMGRLNAPQLPPLEDLETIREAINPTTRGNTLASNSAPMSKRVLGQ
jgi:hypothetical protein